MTYMEQIINTVNATKIGVPIYTADLAEQIMAEFALEQNKAKAAVSVAMKRIMDKELCPNLRFYQKGIYYLTTKTPFGKTGINKEYLIGRKYLHPDNGYETGYAALYRMGLTTQLPNERVIATNAAVDCLREDKKLGVFIKPPKTEITVANKMYLQLLDAAELLDKAPIDEGNPYELLAEHIVKHKIQYDKLLAIADKYYNKNTIIQVAHIAAVGGTL